MPRSRVSRWWKSVVVHRVSLLCVVAVMMAAMAPVANAYPVDPDWAPPSTVFIPETGQTIDGLFLDLWRSGLSRRTRGGRSRALGCGRRFGR